jgi:hypothetical protein
LFTAFALRTCRISKFVLGKQYSPASRVNPKPRSKTKIMHRAETLRRQEGQNRSWVRYRAKTQ